MSDKQPRTPEEELEALRASHSRLERTIGQSRREAMKLRTEGETEKAAEIRGRIHELDQQRQKVGVSIRKVASLVKQREAAAKAAHIKPCAYRLAARDILDEVTLKRIDERASEIRKEMREKKVG
jgi:hypothetical protein